MIQDCESSEQQRRTAVIQIRHQRVIYMITKKFDTRIHHRDHSRYYQPGDIRFFDASLWQLMMILIFYGYVSSRISKLYEWKHHQQWQPNSHGHLICYQVSHHANLCIHFDHTDNDQHSSYYQDMDIYSTSPFKPSALGIATWRSKCDVRNRYVKLCR
jgi:hypothetical protein